MTRGKLHRLNGKPAPRMHHRVITGSNPVEVSNYVIRAQANASVDKLHISVEECLLFTGGAGSIPDGVSKAVKAKTKLVEETHISKGYHVNPSFLRRC